MKFPTSTVPELQRRIDRATELFEAQDEEKIFWLRWQLALTDAAKERLSMRTYKAGDKEELNIKK